MKDKTGLESPYFPVPYEAHHVGAVQALLRGDCAENQQKEFMRWLIEGCCGTYDQSFRVDPYSTAFAEGRRFVGNQVVKMSRLDAKLVAEHDKQQRSKTQ